MLTIYISPREAPIITVDGCHATTKIVLVREAGSFINLQDLKPPSNLENVELVLVRKLLGKKLRLPNNVREAIVNFLQLYHAKQDLEFDCYAFANMVEGVKFHRVPYVREYWNTKPLRWRTPVGSVVLLYKGDQFRHAAVYIGSGSYISVWGAGGDLEFATLKSMKRDYNAREVMLAKPK